MYVKTFCKKDVLVDLLIAFENAPKSPFFKNINFLFYIYFTPDFVCNYTKLL